MSRNKVEDIDNSPTKDFYIASDEGHVWSGDVHAIKGDDDEDITYLRRRHGEVAYVSAPAPVVRQIFREHGFEIIEEGELKRRTESYRARTSTGPA